MIGKILKPDATLVVSLDDYRPGNRRIAEGLAALRVPATFFIETLTREARDQVKALHEMGFEIGSHTMTHPADIKLLNAEELRGELETSKRIIEDLTGEECVAFAFPRGRFNDDVVDAVRAAGYREARTTHVGKTVIPDPLRMPTTIHVYDGRKEYGGRTWRAMADFYLSDVMTRGGVFHIWGHARELERDLQLQPFLDFLSRATTP